MIAHPLIAHPLIAHPLPGVPEQPPEFIGIIGGVGPYAGLDFLKKILDATPAAKDQDHRATILITAPEIIPDRTAFLLGAGPSPVSGMVQCAQRLYAAGARTVCVVCNTAHAPAIFEPFQARVAATCPGMDVVNMLAWCRDHAAQTFPGITCFGLLATRGTYATGVYADYFRPADAVTLIVPDAAGQDQVHQAIYAPDYGIKAHANPVTSTARKIIATEGARLVAAGAQALILGCTELPLAADPADFTVPLLDPGDIMARRLSARACVQRK